MDEKEITANMVKFLKDLGVAEVRRNYRGYAYMALFPGKMVEEEIL